MSLFLQNLQIHDGYEASFGAAEGAFSAKQIRTLAPPGMAPAQQVIPDPSQRGVVAPVYKPILGLKNASKLTFSTWLRGTGTAAGDGVAGLTKADLGELRLLAQALGGEDSSTGTTVDDAAATATSFDVASAAGLAEGNAILVDVGGTLEASVIGSISGTTITLLRALSAAPADTAVVYGGTTYYCSETTPGTLQARLLTSEGNSEGFFQLLGCAATFKLSNLAPGQTPQCDWDVMAASWAHNTGVALPAANYDSSQHPPIPGQASTLMLGTYGSTVRTVLGASAVAIDPGVVYAPVQSVSGVEGVDSYVRSAAAPTCQMTLLDYEGDRVTGFGAGTAMFLHYQLGSTAGGTVLLELPRMFPGTLPQRAEVNSQAGMTVEYHGVQDLTETGELAQSAFRLHLL